MTGFLSEYYQVITHPLVLALSAIFFGFALVLFLECLLYINTASYIRASRETKGVDRLRGSKRGNSLH